MPTLLAICFIAALVAPRVHRAIPKYAGAILMAAPLATFAWLLKQLPGTMHGQPVEHGFQWEEKIGMEAAFRLDGLSLLFALIISGIGMFVVLYTQGYFKGHPQQGRFLMYIIAFMASSMLVTVLGAGMILMADTAGTWRLSELALLGAIMALGAMVMLLGIGTVGVSSIAIGLMIHFGSMTVISRGVLVIAFFLLTAPVAAHMIGRSAYRSGDSLWILTRIDEWESHGEIGKND